MENSTTNNKIIFDIGMHNGRDTRFFLDKGFQVIAVEASPVSCEEATKMFDKELKSGQLKIYNKAISEKKGKVTFIRYIGHDDWSTIVADWNMSLYDKEVETFEVETTNVDEIIAAEGMPYYIKIDIEGSDILCLNALKNVPEIPKYISVELLSINNLKNDSKPDYLEILCTLRSLGYTKFQLVDQSKHATTICPSPALEGNYVNAQFDGFSSGLFGKELPNDWKSIDDVVFDYLVYTGKKIDVKVDFLQKGIKKKIAQYVSEPVVKIDQKLDINGWFDVHATY